MERILDRILAYESGELNEDAEIALFQELLDTNMIYALQGTYQRRLRHLMSAGLVTRKVYD